MLENLALREHAARVQQEEAEQVELGRGEVDPVVGAEDLVASLVEDEIVEAQDIARQLAVRAAQDRLHAGDDLREAERLRHVVVAAGPERLDLVVDAALGGEEEDRGLEPTLPEALPDLEPVDVGKHPVEHDQIGLERHHGGERVAAVAGLLDVEPLVAQGGRDGIDDRRLVVHDQDLGPRSWGCHELVHITRSSHCIL